MKDRLARSGLVVWLAVLGVFGGRAPAEGPKGPASAMIRDGFEGDKTAWRREQTDAPVRIFDHSRTNRASHDGLLSEGFQFEAGIGGGLYYSYPLPEVPLSNDLKVGLYVRSNRPGVQVLARVILPNDVDPDSHRPTFVLVPGSGYESTDRWQKLVIDDLVASVEDQAKVLRARDRRAINLAGAYIERLVVNVYGGEGETDVYLDELTVGPVPAEVAEAHARMISGDSAPRARPEARTVADRPRSAREPLEPSPPREAGKVVIDGGRLTRDGAPWFPTMIRAPEADPDLLRRLGCDVVVVPTDAKEEYVKAAIASGFLLVPELATGLTDAQLPDADRLLASAVAFPWKDHTLFWSLGDDLGRSPNPKVREAALKKVREAARGFRKAKPGGSPFVTATTSGMLAEYARRPENLDLIGVEAGGWATVQEPFETYQYLDQRRLLTARGSADAAIWATVEVTPPPIYREMIWGSDRPPAWGIPRIQPEQVRLETYAVLSSNCRGICFKADGDLSQGAGRMATIELAFLNEEIDLLESILADPDKTTRMLPTFLPDPPPPPPISLYQLNPGMTPKISVPREFGPNPTVRAASIGTKDRRGSLLLVADYYKYAQFQPPQMAANNLKLLVPWPADAIAYLISPGGVRVLDSVRAPGGHMITLDDFGATAIVLLTTNVDLKDQIERAVNSVRPRAVGLAIEQAELHRAWVVDVDYQIRLRGHAQKDWQDLVAKADELIKSAREAQERGEYRLAWDEARRVGRALRILMRYHFMDAYDSIIKILKDDGLPCGPFFYPDHQDKPQPRLVAPIVAAPLASFATLPQAWEWYDRIKTGRLGPNQIASGNFNVKKVSDLSDAGWAEVSYRTDDIVTNIALKEGLGPDKGGPDKKGSDLILEANPRQGTRIDDLVPFVDHPVVAIRSPKIKVREREVYRISVMAFMKNNAVAGAGGLIVRDSIGGERLQFRTPQALANDWFEVVFYRYVPADGEMDITLGMAGYGFCAFDDLRVQPIVEQLTPEQIRLTARPRRRPPADPEKPPTRSADRARPSPIRQ